ncbi:Hypothetical protein CINCED_3A009467 [Cinara cedri]|uniref:Uncharacterized protein n=1 Tax=Cinara cedri TaxID=506608 RepID=A0A5E4MB03_9HEMI|nr:Hypothetical protein CINCED_3A009467 [Cinara cedri]
MFVTSKWKLLIIIFIVIIKQSLQHEAENTGPAESKVLETHESTHESIPPPNVQINIQEEKLQSTSNKKYEYHVNNKFIINNISFKTNENSTREERPGPSRDWSFQETISSLYSVIAGFVTKCFHSIHLT